LPKNSAAGFREECLIHKAIDEMKHTEHYRC